MYVFVGGVDEFLAPSLLRQFKPAQAGIVRTCSISCFELILWPFEDYHLTETAEGEEEDAIDSDEPNLEEKQKVVVRLVKLVRPSCSSLFSQSGD